MILKLVVKGFFWQDLTELLHTNFKATFFSATAKRVRHSCNAAFCCSTHLFRPLTPFFVRV